MNLWDKKIDNRTKHIYFITILLISGNHLSKFTTDLEGSLCLALAAARSFMHHLIPVEPTRELGDDWLRCICRWSHVGSWVWLFFLGWLIFNRGGTFLFSTGNELCHLLQIIIWSFRSNVGKQVDSNVLVDINIYNI